MKPWQKVAAGVAMIGASTVALVAKHEGLRTNPYLDVVGVETVCYGHTGDDIEDKQYTKAECDALLAKDLKSHTEPAIKCIGVPLTQGEFDSYSSLAFNVGPARVCNSSIPRLAQAGQRRAACDALLEFNKARDRTKPKILNPKTGKWEHPLVEIRGLTNRRVDEHKLCVKDL